MCCVVFEVCRLHSNRYYGLLLLLLWPLLLLRCYVVALLSRDVVVVIGVVSGVAIYVGDVGYVFGCVRISVDVGFVVALMSVVVPHHAGCQGDCRGTVDDNISETFFMGMCVNITTRTTCLGERTLNSVPPPLLPPNGQC